MGYVEVGCQLCAVSINTARLRTKHEPAEDGWGYTGGEYYCGEAITSRCSISSRQSGCENLESEGNDEIKHIPGRGCTFQGGYNGWKISAEEMRGMNLPRHIVKKPRSYAPGGEKEGEEEEEEYEKGSQYFVTTRTTRPPVYCERHELEKNRFEVNDFCPQNYETGAKWDERCRFGVPVHQACWSLFERVSKEKLGRVDLDGFMALWYRQACRNCGFQNMKQDPVIMRCREQNWEHLAGTEYLASNPYKIPGFLLALQDSYHERPSGDGVFWTRHSITKATIRNNSDVFAAFPQELKNIVLSYLDSKDIASLRLVSRSFCQLPKALFLRLIQDELPWFWEFAELKEAEHEHANFWEEGIDKGKEKDEEGVPVGNINWLEMYKALCILKKSILGVRNRARVWHLVEEVVERIRSLRAGVKAEGGKFSVELTEQELEHVVSKNSFSCPRCEFYI